MLNIFNDIISFNVYPYCNVICYCLFLGDLTPFSPGFLVTTQMKRKPNIGDMFGHIRAEKAVLTATSISITINNI